MKRQILHPDSHITDVVIQSGNYSPDVQMYRMCIRAKDSPHWVEVFILLFNKNNDLNLLPCVE